MRNQALCAIKANEPASLKRKIHTSDSTVHVGDTVFCKLTFLFFFFTINIPFSYFFARNKHPYICILINKFYRIWFYAADFTTIDHYVKNLFGFFFVSFCTLLFLTEINTFFFQEGIENNIEIYGDFFSPHRRSTKQKLTTTLTNHAHLKKVSWREQSSLNILISLSYLNSANSRFPKL